MPSCRLIRQRAFTLIELLVVILIIGILVAVAAPSFIGQTYKASDSAVKQQLAVSRLEAKAVWTSAGGTYPTIAGAPDSATFASQLQAAEPSYRFAAGPNTATMTTIDVTETDSNTVTMCEQSTSATIFCEEISETSGLTQLTASPSAAGSLFAASTAQAAATTDVLYSTACTETAAVTALSSGSGHGASIGWGAPTNCVSFNATAPPHATTTPAITGTVTVGQTLVGTPAVWSSTPASETWQWQDCDALGNNCTAIPLATGNQYIIGGTDVGDTIRFADSAANGGTPAIAQSLQTSVIGSVAPAYQAAVKANSPYMYYRLQDAPGTTVAADSSGNAHPGTYSSATGVGADASGPFVGDVAFADAAGNDVTSTSSGNTIGETYEMWFKTSSNANQYILYRSSSDYLSISGGQLTAETWASNPVTTSTTSGINYADGNWHMVDMMEDNPSTKARLTLYVDGVQAAQGSSTQSLNAGAGISYLGGKTTSLLTGSEAEYAAYPTALTAGQVDSHYLASGHPLDVNTAVPTIAGTPTVGQTLTATTGAWASTPSSYDYQWENCSVAAVCAVIPGATGSAYTVAGSDQGYTLRVLVTAIISSGDGQALSAATATAVPGINAYEQAVMADHPSLYYEMRETSGTTAYDATGNRQTGAYTTSSGVGADSNGPFFGDVAFSAAANVLASASVSPTGTGASYELWFKTSSAGTSSLYSQGTTDTLTISSGQLTASTYGNGGGSELVASTVGQSYADGSWHMVDVVEDNLVSLPSLPKGRITVYVDGALVAQNSSSTSSVNGGGGPWYLGGISASPTTHFPGSLADASRYAAPALSAAQVATHYLASGHSLDVNTSAPTITGTPAVGQTLTATTGAWASTPSSYSYQWENCAVSGLCAAIPGATSAAYTVAGSDQGYTLRVLVTAASSSGNGGALSAASIAVPGANAYEQAVMADHPSLYYEMRETSGTAAYDATGNRQTGTYTTSAGVGADSNGPVFGDVAFASSADVLASTSVSTTATGVSYELWFKTSSAGTAYLYSQGGGDDSLTISAGQLTATTFGGGTLSVTTSGPSYADGSWHMVDVVEDDNLASKGRVTLYVDGAQVAQKTAAAGALNGDSGLWFLGGNSASPTTHFPGSLAEAARYTSIALSSTQVANHWAAR